MLKKFLIYLLLLFSVSCGTKRFTVKKESENNTKCSSIVFDNQSNKYHIRNNEIHKLDIQNDTIFKYSSNLYGDVSKLDVSNPLRPLIYYSESQKIIITDNTLSKQQQQIINLDEVNLYQTVTIAHSTFDNGIWIYDQNNFQLIKINTFLKKTLETGNLTQILAINDFTPIKMQESNGLLYLECKNNGILVFDMYGTFYKNIGLVGVKNWNIENDRLYFITDTEISLMDLKTKEISTLKSSEVLIDKEVINISSMGITFCTEHKPITLPFSEL